MLQEKREKDINEGKIQFFMNLVHDLRTPITLISTPLQKLMQVDNAPERTRLYQIINRNVGRLLSLTNQIMDLRKIDRGMMEIHCAEVPVSNVIRSIVNSMIDVAETRRITLCMNDMTEDQLQQIVDTFVNGGDEVTVSYRETSHGTKLMIVQEAEGSVDYVAIVSVYEGYMIEFDMMTGVSDEEGLTEAQIQMCIDFLSDLDFIPEEA
jgi:K+-sensing histidine kinase KdpD